MALTDCPECRQQVSDIIMTWALGDVILGMFVFFTRPKES